MPLPFAVASIRDFYAFEQHVKTCRKHRGLDMVPAWYQVPAFYFSNPVAIIGDGDSVHAPQGSNALDYELELACVIGSAARDLPADDSAMNCVAGFTIMNDWSARDIQRAEMAIGLGPSKSKDFATSLGPRLVPFDELKDDYRDGRLHLEMTATRERQSLFPRQRRQHVLDLAAVIGPCEPRYRAAPRRRARLRARSAPAASWN